jgi:hypothetical protein
MVINQQICLHLPVHYYLFSGFLRSRPRYLDTRVSGGSRAQIGEWGQGGYTWTGTEGGELQGYIATLVAWPQQATRGLRLRPPCSACREEQHQDTVMLGPAPGILPTTLSNRAPQSPQDLHPRCVDPKVQKIIQHARSLSTENKTIKQKKKAMSNLGVHKDKMRKIFQDSNTWENGYWSWSDV